jgi:hypothetical protein
MINTAVPHAQVELDQKHGLNLVDGQQRWAGFMNPHLLSFKAAAQDAPGRVTSNAAMKTHSLTTNAGNALLSNLPAVTYSLPSYTRPAMNFEGYQLDKHSKDTHMMDWNVLEGLEGTQDEEIGTFPQIAPPQPSYIVSSQCG